MFQKIIHFIKYHNAFTIGLGLVIFITAGVFASSDTLVGQKVETAKSVDNSFILTADLANFDTKLQIKSIQEDADNYYINYSYQTIAIQDYVWQPVTEEKNLVVSKKALGEKDLGLFVAEELGETLDYQLSYLKEVQGIEKEKGLTQKVVDTQYAGLIGKFLNPEEKVFPGYTPVVTPPEIAVQPENTAPTLSFPAEPAPLAVEVPPSGTQAGAPQPTPQPTIDKEAIRQIVLELLAQQQSGIANQELGIMNQGEEAVLEPEPEPEPEQEPEQEPEPEQELELEPLPVEVPLPEIPAPEVPAVETTTPAE